MSWYKQSRELPTIENKYPDKWMRQRGLNYLDVRLTPEHAQELSEPGMSYLGSGGYGSAFAINEKNIVKKYTGDNKELSAAKAIISKQQNNQPLEGLVYVYAVRDLSHDIYIRHKEKFPDLKEDSPNNALFEVTLEKVKPLSSKEDYIFTNFYRALMDIMQGRADLNNDGVFKELKSRFNVEHIAKPIEENKKFINMMINFNRVVINNSYRDVDIHSGNVGIRNGDTIVILDLGAIVLPM